MTQNNLGIVYRDLPTGNQVVNSERAIVCFQEALRIYKPETEPLSYAMVQHNLAGAYWKLPAGDQGDNLERAISCFREALRFYTPEIAPLDYAVMQNNLGVAYARMRVGSPITYLQKAIDCFEEALRFYTLQTAPKQYRMVNRNIANLYFGRQEWKVALRYFRSAMEAGERLYQAGLSVETKEVEIRENAFLYHRAVFASVRCQETTEAFFILEQGKTRLLTETLRLQIVRPTAVPDTIWKAYEEAGVAIQTIQAERGIGLESEHTPLEALAAYEQIEALAAYEQKMYTANAALDTSIRQVRLYAPNFLQGLDLNSIQPLIVDGYTALITFCFTEQGSMGLIAGPQSQEVTVVELPTFTQVDLRHLFIERDAVGEVAGGWLGAYQRHQQQPNTQTSKAWQDTITHNLTTLGQTLIHPILLALPFQITRLIFLPSAELFLFPLHAVSISETTTTCVCDQYQVSYAPSIEVLLTTRGKTKNEVIPRLYAVINPETDSQLAFTSIEAQALARLFAQHHIDEGPLGTKERVIVGIQDSSYVHFSCHGRYNWNDPTKSGLSLADGQLTLYELQQKIVDLTRTRVVTLSACETGISDVIHGNAEEYVGIPAGFLLAGVSCVISSLWAVSDLSTALLMERFYHNHLFDGMDFSTALGKAQRWLRQASAHEMGLAELWKYIYQKSGESDAAALRAMRYYRFNPEIRPFAHPYYWAAFTVNGA
jgi:CHAT domain-containing protein/tetratricopeptide (TPR) repeat protein